MGDDAILRIGSKTTELEVLLKDDKTLTLGLDTGREYLDIELSFEDSAKLAWTLLAAVYNVPKKGEG